MKINKNLFYFYSIETFYSPPDCSHVPGCEKSSRIKGNCYKCMKLYKWLDVKGGCSNVSACN